MGFGLIGTVAATGPLMRILLLRNIVCKLFSLIIHKKLFKSMTDYLEKTNHSQHTYSVLSEAFPNFKSVKMGRHILIKRLIKSWHVFVWFSSRYSITAHIQKILVTHYQVTRYWDWIILLGCYIREVHDLRGTNAVSLGFFNCRLNQFIILVTEDSYNGQ